MWTTTKKIIKWIMKNAGLGTFLVFAVLLSIILVHALPVSPETRGHNVRITPDNSELKIDDIIIIIVMFAVFIGIAIKIIEDYMTLIFSFILAIMMGVLLFVVIRTEDGGMFAEWLGVLDPDKKTTIEFIAYGIIGALGVINVVAINRRANAQEKNNDDYRFQNLVNNLGHERATVRTISFNRFYYLALKGEGKKGTRLRNDVFEILCSYLRVLSGVPPCTLKEKYEYFTESQTLFDILFKGKFKTNSMTSGLIHNIVKADMRNARFTDIDFSDANLSEVDFRGAQFNNVNFEKVYRVTGADFRGATINGEQVSIKHFPKDAECHTYDHEPRYNLRLRHHIRAAKHHTDNYEPWSM